MAMTRASRKRWLVASFLGMLLAVVLAPLTGYLLVDNVQAQITSDGENQRSEFWRAVRRGTEGYSAVEGQETNVLIQNGGENWRALRNGPVKFYGSILLIVMLVTILGYHAIKGGARLPHRSGLTVERWTVFERTIHWYTACLFLIMMITGLSLLFGRYALIPVIGKDAFAAYASVAKNLHNYLGPFFAAGLAIEIIMWIRHNIPNKVDLEWFKRGGGIVGSAHPHAGRMNGGEKLWFWILCTIGVAMIIAGFVLNFPNYGQTRGIMQLAHLIHVGTSIIVMAVALGHIYIGTLGSEGSLEGMVTGRVDTEWAKKHHDLWYEDLVEQGVKLETAKPADNDHLPAGSRTT